MAYCYTCKGTGLKDENNVCPECNGFGTLPEAEVIVEPETAVEAPETPEASESFSPSEVEPEASESVDEAEVIVDAATEGAEVPEINSSVE